jgi:signal transduction histidine kinase
MQKMKSNPAKTALTISMGFLLIFWFTKLKWAIVVALIVGITAIVSETLSKYIEKAWMKLAFILSLIVPNIVLGVVFFVFLLPLSLLSKVFRKEDALKLKNKFNSVYSEKNKEYDKAHFENMW